MKVARTVLNGERGGNPSDLHNQLKNEQGEQDQIIDSIRQVVKTTLFPIVSCITTAHILLITYIRVTTGIPSSF